MTSSRPTRRPRRSSGPSKKHSNSKAEELHPVEDVPEIDSFREFALDEDIQETVQAMGITEPTPIQKLAIGPVLEGRDVIAKAETGTGKTLAFGAPMMSRIEAERATVLGLVLCPTRELAQQVWQVLAKLGETRGVKVALVVGGDPMHPQVDALKDGAQVVVGTPGRVLDLYQQRFLSFPWTEFAVLDEADEMLEIGFIDDVRKILDFCPDERQTLLFSATFPPELLRLARDHTKDPIEVATAKGVASVENITHYVTRADESDRPSKLKRLIGATAEDDVLLVFCDRRTEVERLMRALERTRWSVKALHGGYDQAARFRVMSAFREGAVKVLVATDVASRGLDIKHVTHVINYSTPRSITAYTHRAGRTGRAGRSGAVMTIVTPADERRWRDVERQMTWPVVDFDAERGPEFEDESRGGRRGGRDGEARGRRGRRSEEREPRRREDAESSESTAEERPRRGRARTEDAEAVREERSRERSRDSESRGGRRGGRGGRGGRAGRSDRGERRREPELSGEDREARRAESTLGALRRSARTEPAAEEPAAREERRPRRRERSSREESPREQAPAREDGEREPRRRRRSRPAKAEGGDEARSEPDRPRRRSRPAKAEGGDEARSESERPRRRSRPAKAEGGESRPEPERPRRRSSRSSEDSGRVERGTSRDEDRGSGAGGFGAGL